MTTGSRDEWATELDSGNVEETIEIGRRIGSALAPGDVVALVGELGAGKTHLVKGLACGLGVADHRVVTSPTFVLVNEYKGRCRVFHLDAYRLSGQDELEDLGFEEMCDRAGAVVVEWADRVTAAIGPDALWIEMSATGQTRRRLRLTARSCSIGRRVGAAVR